MTASLTFPGFIYLLLFPSPFHFCGCRGTVVQSFKENVFFFKSTLNISLVFVAQVSIPRTQKIPLSTQIDLDLKETMGKLSKSNTNW